MNEKEKIGMYSTDEILEFMTEGEGRGFLGRSMFDAMYFKIENLQSKIDKAIDWIEQYEKQIGTLGETSKSIVLTDDVVIGNLLDILKEDK